MHGTTRSCPFCSETIQAQARKCRFCGEFFDPQDRLDYQQRVTVQGPDTNLRLVAAGLSFFLPGLGQIVRGNVLSGIIWMIATTIGYLLLVLPGLVIHGFCIYDAAREEDYS